MMLPQSYAAYRRDASARNAARAEVKVAQKVKADQKLIQRVEKVIQRLAAKFNFLF